MIKKILIANRGEIAVRIIKACRELGIISASIYSDSDVNSQHVRLADEAYHIGPSNSLESYLSIEKVISKALEIKADAIHPGYGFFSENAEFIKRVTEAGIIFIGPSYQSVEMMGSKTAARTLMSKHSVPIVPGTIKPIETLDDAKNIAVEIGFPIMIKASAGGGGKGMRKVSRIEELEESINRAKNEAQKAFGNSDLYIEKFIENPKHIEVQIIGDKFGNYVHLFERECSIQRRHQKVVEEAPSSSINKDLRDKATKIALDAAKACNYYNAGTIELLYDQNESFYFLEMNTRLQVEHPVTEMITGIDIVKEQIRIADGKELSVKQEEIKINGHSIECRIYAEDVDNNFAPSTGKIVHYSIPSGPGIRVDSGIDVNSDVTIYYDPILSKLVSLGRNREEAIVRMQRALKEFQISGIKTNLNLFHWILDHIKFKDSSFDINFLDNDLLPLVPNKWRENINEDYSKVASILGAYLKSREKSLKVVQIKTSKFNNWDTQNHE